MKFILYASLLSLSFVFAGCSSTIGNMNKAQILEIDGKYSEAAKLYQKEANKGQAEAQNNLGVLYRKGKGVPKNHQKAMSLYKKSAAQGNAQAMNNIALLYAKGYGVKKSYDTAEIWYKKAIQHGAENAQMNLDAMNKEMNSHLSSFTVIRDKNGKVINAFSTPAEKPL